MAVSLNEFQLDLRWWAHPSRLLVLAWFGNHLTTPISSSHCQVFSYSLVHFVTVEDNIYELFPEVLCNCGSGSEHDCRSGMPIVLCPLNVLVLVTGVQSPLSHSLCLLHTTYYSLNVLLLCSPGRLINIECSRSLAVIDLAWR